MFKLIHDNPFRILSLPVDADARRISNRQAELKMYLQIKSPEEMEDEFKPILLPINYSTEKIQEAYNSLSKDADRIYHSLFWFQNYTGIDSQAVEALKAGRHDIAAKLWQAQVQENAINEQNFTGYKNLALLYIIAFPRERDYESRELTLKGVNLFFQTWCFFAGNKFYKKLPGTEHISNLDLLTRRLIAEFVAGFNPFMGRGVAFTIADILAALPCQVEMGTLKNKLSIEFSSGPLERLTRKIDRADQELNSDNADYYSIGTNLLNETRNMHSEANVLIPEQEYLLISDKLAQTVARSAILHFNKAKARANEELRTEEAIKLAESAKLIARSEITILKIEEDIQIFRKLATQLNYIDEFKTILAKLPQNIYKLSQQEVNDYPAQVAIIIDEAAALIHTIKQEQGINSEVTRFMTDWVFRELNNLLIEYGNHTYRYDAVVPVLNKLGIFNPSQKEITSFNKNVEVINQNIKNKDDSNSGCLGTVLLLSGIIYIVYSLSM